MPEEPLVTLSLDAYVAFFVVVAVVIGLMFWLLSRRDKRARDKFFSQYDPKDLRMSPYKIGLVYRVVKESADGVAVIPIWDQDQRVTDPKEIFLSEEALVPFDSTRFS